MLLSVWPRLVTLCGPTMVSAALASMTMYNVRLPDVGSRHCQHVYVLWLATLQDVPDDKLVMSCYQDVSREGLKFYQACRGYEIIHPY